MKNIQVSIIIGSDSDLKIIKEAVDVLKEFSISHELKILSAHRSPKLLVDYLKNTEIEVIIAGAGLAAHLPGVIAAYSICPVIGVPIPSGALNGLDSLLSISQMPSGMPVGTMTIGSPGAKNAGLYAIQILSLGSKELKEKLRNYKKNMENKIIEKNKNLN